MSTSKRPSPSGGSRGSRGPQSHRAHRGPPHRPHGAARGSRAKIEPLHPTEIPPDIHDFGEWNLGPDVQGAIAAMGITVPTPIQKLAIGPVLAGRDVIAKAETGTGKTLAFGAPMMAKIDPARASVLGLVLCPTRELAEQVMKVLAKLGEPRGIKTALVVGGEPLGPQVDALKAGSQVVVGTPGRILDLYNQKWLSFPWTEFAILDEADVMLEIGFIDDVKQILAYTPDERQTLLFSATFPNALLELARAHTKDPVEVATASGIATIDAIEQTWMHLDDEDRPLALTRLIEQSEPDDVFLVFCDKRTEVDRLMRRLERLPYSLKALHGGYDQEARFRVMSAFRTKEVKALVATDVASRGLDVLHVTHVINYSAPRDITDYTHRIGRTGRAGRSGRAITFVTGYGMRYWKRILADKNWPILEADPPSSTRDRRPSSTRDRPSSSTRDRPSSSTSDRPSSSTSDRSTRAQPHSRGPARSRERAHSSGDRGHSSERHDSEHWPVDPGAKEFAVEHDRQRSGGTDEGRPRERGHGDARPASLKPHGDPIVEHDPQEHAPTPRREHEERRPRHAQRERAPQPHPPQHHPSERREHAPRRAPSDRPPPTAGSEVTREAPQSHREPRGEPRQSAGRSDRSRGRQPEPERSSDAPAGRERGSPRHEAQRERLGARHAARSGRPGRGASAQPPAPHRSSPQRPSPRPSPHRPPPHRPGNKTDFGTGL